MKDFELYSDTYITAPKRPFVAYSRHTESIVSEAYNASQSCIFSKTPFLLSLNQI